MISCSDLWLVFLFLYNEKQYMDDSLSGMHQGLWMQELSSTVCQTPVDPIGIIILVDLIFPHKGFSDAPYIEKGDENKWFSEAPKHNTVSSFILKKAHLC